jgi:NAD(P)-dependent dehydrogenase (short-subunit alcohol dehydrogenase family)
MGVHLAAGDVKLLDRVLEVNLQSVVHASRALLPHLISTSVDFRRVREPTLLRDDGVAVEASSGKPAARGTTLIIISSMIAQQLALFPGHAAYIASKMGVAGWADGACRAVTTALVAACERRVVVLQASLPRSASAASGCARYSRAWSAQVGGAVSCSLNSLR